MKLIKKLILISISTIIIAIGFQAVSFAQDFYYNYDTNSSADNTNIGSMIKTDGVENNDNALNKLLDLFGLSDKSWYNDAGNDKAINYIKMIINIALSLVSLIALIMLIYAFYLMFFAKQESGMARAKQILKGVAIALAIMGLSRFIVSFIFRMQSSQTP